MITKTQLKSKLDKLMHRQPHHEPVGIIKGYDPDKLVKQVNKLKSKVDKTLAKYKQSEGSNE